MTPCWQSQTTISAVLWPVRLSHTRSMRSNGDSVGKVKPSARPSCQASQARRVTAASGGAAGGGLVARVNPSRSLSQPCRTGLVQLPTGWRYTWPVAGWNRVRILQVPPRTYSCGRVAGWGTVGIWDYPEFRVWGRTMLLGGPSYAAPQTARHPG